MKQVGLIIIDMQQGMSWPQAGERNNPDAEHNIAELLAHWRAVQAPVIHIRHLSTDPDSLFWPEQEGVLFQEAFEPLDGEKVFEKSVPDAFIHSNLADWLAEQQIDSLVIVGVSTNNSVESTVRSAGNLGFKAYVVESACFAFQKEDFFGLVRSADDVHAMSLANLHGEYATVISQEGAFALLPQDKVSLRK
ncbi:cysteine hydrolase family protein [Marinomonas posidonica]|uniref:Isochorismatase hydrolase n=1 Tax=Marinomonas posidonica (strain CECT 7376 / NCIMB 14433 / IVIA-Po-181) TaxID=491952 RepID=F6D1E2_MARPP|nr:cysteine hydrolase family protein [Marinomonas posidonica]AEF56031.1 isochorismatase hydrolase [Marinomonas posidonica IVIA-Po-181]